MKNLISSNLNSLRLLGGLIVISLLLIPYASNGYWFDDSLNSQVYYLLHRTYGGLGEFAFRITKHWIEHEGRPMLGFLYGYSGFYFVNDLAALRLAQCVTVVINIALYGYVLWLLGATIRFLVVWATIVVGLFQIHGTGLDPVAAFAFHYQVLGIQLSIVLILFVKWLQNSKPKYLYAALILWLLFMLCYEVNLIFIPIAFAIMCINGNAYKERPGLLLFLAAFLYFTLTYYLRSHSDGGSYDGAALGVPSEMGLAYVKHVATAFPFVSYFSITQNSLPIASLVKEMISSSLAWAVFVFSLTVLIICIPIKSSVRALRTEAFIISLGMLLLPAIFPAISLRYQNQVEWGTGTLPVYYQYFGLAFFIAWSISFITTSGLFRFVVPVIISSYLAFNLTLNFSMVKQNDMVWREPRDAFAAQSPISLFFHVQDGDIVNVKNVTQSINENLIFQLTGKRVYIPIDDHYWYPESPKTNAKTFVLSRNATSDRNYQLVEMLQTKAEYQRIPPHPDLVKNLTTFPATLPLVEIQIELKETKVLDSVRVLAGGGEWITSSVNQGLWGVAVVDNEGGVYKIMNDGPRKEKMGLPVNQKITLWIPNSGDLSKCPQFEVELLFGGGERVSTVAACTKENK